MKARKQLLSVIIPQHGQSRLTVAAVRSLLEQHPHPPEVIVVDDGGPLRERRSLHAAALAEVQVVPLVRNSGVTAAWNLGWRQARGEVLVFLNNDTLSTGAWLPQLCRPVLDGEGGISGIALREEPHLPDPLRSRTGDRMLEGWCLAVCRETLESLGGFDEQLRLYFSDTDLQCRILARCGFQRELLIPVPGLPLVHLGHCSTRKLSCRSFQWNLDRRHFQRKWGLVISWQ